MVLNLPWQQQEAFEQGKLTASRVPPRNLSYSYYIYIEKITTFQISLRTDDIVSALFRFLTAAHNSSLG